MAEPYELTLTEAASLQRNGQLSARELVDSLLDRIEVLDGAVQAWVRIDADGARATAGLLDEERRERRLRGPLHGAPIGLKDIYHTAGLATEAGSPLRRGFVPDRDAAAVARLRAAGAIVLGKTETTQFANADAARTRNPWNLAHTPGGSSSGSAAAVAARMVPAALGTQTAGSVLRPASFCGVVGFKPSRGRISLEGVFPLAWSLDHAGTLTRCVADARLLFATLDEGVHHPAGGASSPLRLGLLRGGFIDQADPAARLSVEQAATTLANAGAAVQDLRLDDDFDLCVDVQQLIMRVEAAAYHAADHARDPDAYRPHLRATIELGALVPAPLYLQAQRLRKELAAKAAAMLDEVDCLLMPSALGAAPADLSTTGDPVFNAPWSLFGFPTISLPSGLNSEGLPLGLQLIGRPMADEQLLEAAAWCESALGELPGPTVVAR